MMPEGAGARQCLRRRKTALGRKRTQRRRIPKLYFTPYLAGRQTAFERGEVAVLRAKFTRLKEMNERLRTAKI